MYYENGAPPPYYEKRPQYHKSNGYVKQPPPVFMEPLPMVAPPPVRVPAAPHYATYHGPPPEMQNYAPRTHAQRTHSGTVSGPPPIVIPFGTMPFRADPRPVVHKSKRKRESAPIDARRHSPRHRSPGRPQSQEFVIQQSYDGIPVIRPVIYVDDDGSDSKKHRSKSRERRYKKRSTETSPSGPRIT